MADGTVVEFVNDRPGGSKPGEDLSLPDSVNGNHFYLQRGDELVLYAHFRKGSLDPSLMTKSNAVKGGAMMSVIWS